MRPRLSPRALLALAAGLVVAAVVADSMLIPGDSQSPRAALPLRAVTQVGLPGDNSRFDYESVDPDRGLPGVHGVLVVSARHRVYATATDADEMVTIDETTGKVLRRSRTGDYPDGLACDPVHGTVWTTNESAGSETVIDAGTWKVRGTVAVGGEAGNVAYDLPPVGCWSPSRRATTSLSSTPPPSTSPAASRSPAASTTTASPSLPPIDWLSSPATATPACSPSTWPPSASPAPTRSAKTPTSLPTTPTPDACTSLRNQAESPSPTSATGT
ncbi:YncE family protein [Streptomyces justiciae]|uniref:Uncharacterized protein n=1 Tax=Streptomyces justiciae TaxID=2780140 RepID=A0ABU3LKZ0_9ACTN|nr:hypothetical protein [Streptomyces justiciae]MDT7839723.1 hypothetical protein [Streptomyces justiciae]